ncbi:MAG: hypothetical protein WB676_28685 [Bryobacteraceae bacterium]
MRYFGAEFRAYRNPISTIPLRDDLKFQQRRAKVRIKKRNIPEGGEEYDPSTAVITLKTLKKLGIDLSS